MKISQSICSAATALIATLGVSSASAITIRDDLWEGYYRSRGNAYPSVGRMSINDSTVCSGTLIAQRWVLTAAHCVDYLTTIGAFDVGHSTYSISRSRAYQHPAWARNSRNYYLGVDVALLRLDRPVRDVRLAPLITRRFREVGQVGTYVGFGNTGTGLSGETQNTFGLRRGADNAVDDYGTYYGWSNRLLLSDFDSPRFTLFNNSLGSSDFYNLEGSIARGDSGGGLFINGRLAGVNSFMYPNTSSYLDNIADASYGDVMAATRVSQFVPWIMFTIRRNLITSSSLSLSNGSTINQQNINSATEATSSAASSKSIPEPSTIVGLLAIVFAAIFVRHNYLN